MGANSEVEPNAKDQERSQVFFQYGNDAALKGNFDYAIAMYLQALKIQPGQLTFRQALRGVQRRKFANDPTKVGRMVGTKTQPIRLRARASVAQGHYTHALEVLEEAFTHNPWDVGAAVEAAHAAENLQFFEMAKWLMESVLAQVSDDLSFFKFLARIYEQTHDYQKAIACWDRVKKISPFDEDASRNISALSASHTITRSGLNQAVARRTLSGEEAEGADSGSGLPPEAEALKRTAQTPEQRWLTEIAENPQMSGAYLKLADHFRGQGRLDEAEKILAQGIKAIPDDELLQKDYADVQMARMKKAIDRLTAKLRENPQDAAAKTKLEQVRTMLGHYELKELRRRAEREPGDARLHLELGQKLAQAGQHEEAIKEFQQARNSAELKVQALYNAGLSFEANGVNKLAERSYQDAIKATDADDHAMQNALHYRLGRLAENQGQLDLAEDHYNEVAANDYGYQDIAVRLKALNQRRES